MLVVPAGHSGCSASARRRDLPVLGTAGDRSSSAAPHWTLSLALRSCVSGDSVSSSSPAISRDAVHGHQVGLPRGPRASRPWWRDRRSIVGLISIVGKAGWGYLMDRRSGTGVHPGLRELRLSIGGWSWRGRIRCHSCHISMPLCWVSVTPSPPRSPPAVASALFADPAFHHLRVDSHLAGFRHRGRRMGRRKDLRRHGQYGRGILGAFGLICFSCVLLWPWPHDGRIRPRNVDA